MAIINFIKAKIELAKKKNKEELKRKFFEIRGEVIKFYEDKDATNGSQVNIPAFMRADQTLKEIIKTPQDINFYYGKLLEYRRVSA